MIFRNRDSSLRRSASPASLATAPDFELLERRLALSCTASVVDGVLFIEGDGEPNIIDVTIDGTGGTLTAEVACDGPLDVSGLDPFQSVEIDGGDGADIINVVVGNVSVGTDEAFFLAVEGGKGEDMLTLTAFGLAAADGGTLSLEVDGGKGDDMLTADILDLSVGDGGVVSIEVEGGQDHDMAFLNLGTVDDAVSVEAGGNLEVAVELGKGDDTATVSATNTSIHGTASLSLELGKGNDSATVTVTDLVVSESGFLTASLEGGPGDDGSDSPVEVTLDGLTIDGTVAVNIEGGPGDDSGTVNIDNATIGATANVAVFVEGGPGDDTGIANLGPNITIDPDATVIIDIDEGP
jgi:hypothetical protein